MKTSNSYVLEDSLAPWRIIEKFSTSVAYSLVVIDSHHSVVNAHQCAGNGYQAFSVPNQIIYHPFEYKRFFGGNENEIVRIQEQGTYCVLANNEIEPMNRRTFSPCRVWIVLVTCKKITLWFQFVIVQNLRLKDTFQNLAYKFKKNSLFCIILFHLWLTYATQVLLYVIKCDQWFPLIGK